jgi:hypothetical protein
LFSNVPRKAIIRSPAALVAREWRQAIAAVVEAALQVVAMLDRTPAAPGIRVAEEATIAKGAPHRVLPITDIM